MYMYCTSRTADMADMFKCLEGTGGRRGWREAETSS